MIGNRATSARTSLSVLAALALTVLAGCGGRTSATTAAPSSSTAGIPTVVPTVATTVAPTVAPTVATTVATTVPPASTPPTVATTVPPASTPSTTTACPADLASDLADTDGASQLVTVEATGYDTIHATIELWQRTSGCWVPAGGPWDGMIGYNGFSDHHHEGDGTSPTGIYGFASTVYGIAPNPGTSYPYHQLECGDWWDEDPTTADYNTFQHITCGQKPPFGGGSEALWTESPVYLSFIPIEYNTDPVIPYAGSAIFFHVDDGSATTGCVSIPQADLDQFLRWVQPHDDPHIVMGPASEISSF